MAFGAQILARTVTAGQNAGPALSLKGVKHFTCIVPALGTASKCRLQVSADGSSWFDLKDTGGNTLEFASGSGGFAMDGDYTARAYGFSYVRSYLDTAPAADVTFTFVLFQE